MTQRDASVVKKELIDVRYRRKALRLKGLRNPCDLEFFILSGAAEEMGWGVRTLWKMDDLYDAAMRA